MHFSVLGHNGNSFGETYADRDFYQSKFTWLQLEAMHRHTVFSIIPRTEKTFIRILQKHHKDQMLWNFSDFNEVAICDNTPTCSRTMNQKTNSTLDSWSASAKYRSSNKNLQLSFFQIFKMLKTKTNTNCKWTPMHVLKATYF